MSNIKLDLKQFKHKDSDEHSTTLIHPDGHTITLAHKPLSKPNQEQLKALAKMSSQSETPDQSKQKSRDADVERKDRPDTGYGKIIYKAEGGGVVPQEGFFGTIDPKAAELLPKAPEPEATTPDDIFNKNVASKVQTMRQENYSHLPDAELQKKAEQSTLDEMAKAKVDQEAAVAAKEKGAINQQVASEGSYKAQVSDITAENEKRAALGLSPKPLPTPPPGLLPQKEGMPEQGSGIASQEAAPVEQPQSVEVPAQPPAPAVTKPESGGIPATQAQMPQAPKIDPGSKFLEEDQAWAQDLNNGHITPKTYQSMFADKSTLGKIGTIFGLMVSGAGAGLTRGPNMLLEMMNKEIDRDLESQKASKNNAMNFHNFVENHNMNQANISHMRLGDAIAADAFKQQLAGRAAFHDLTMKTQAMPDGPMKQQALQTLGLISQGLDAKAQGAADMLNAKQQLMNGLMGPSSAGTSDEAFQQEQRRLRMTGHEDLAKDNESKYYPGLGKSSIPLTSESRNAIQAATSYDKQLRRFIDWTSKHSGSLSPTDINTGKVLAAELQGAYRKASDGGVYKEGEQHFISSIIDSDPTKFFNKIRVLPQLKALAHENQIKLDGLVKSMGFPGYQGPPIANDQVKGADGKMYVKSADGKYMIPVK